MTEDWDERYASKAAGMWSGRANPSLVTEITGVVPGRALDVGCGEGGDAIWLAGAGWDVTGIDVSTIAIERATAAAAAAGVTVSWLARDIADVAPTGFDLVAVHYPALPHRAAGALLGAVAPGGTLLAVWHADVDAEWARGRGFELADYVQVDDVRGRLRGWSVEVDERRPRAGAHAHHSHDLVLRARRAPAPAHGPTPPTRSMS